MSDTADRFDLAANPGARAYRLLAGLVTPRPIALVTTVDAAGRPNAAPFSFFNVMGAEPALLVLAPADRDDGTPKDTAANLAATGEAVVHVVDEPLAARMVACAADLPPGVSELDRFGFRALAARMVACSADLPPGVSEIDRFGFRALPSERVRPPRLAECPVAIECRVLDIRRYGDNRLVVLEGLLAHVRPGLADPATWKVDPARHAPVGRMESPDGYVRTRDRFRIPRPD